MTQYEYKVRCIAKYVDIVSAVVNFDEIMFISETPPTSDYKQEVLEEWLTFALISMDFPGENSATWHVIGGEVEYLGCYEV